MLELYHVSMLLIDLLLDMVFPPRDAQARVQRTSFASLTPFIEPSVFEVGDMAITSLLPYRTPEVKACIREAKFHRNTRAHSLLGEVLAEYLNEFSAERYPFQKEPVVLVPIPLSQKRRRERGHNQAESIARRALTYARTPFVLDTRILIRSRDTAPQTSLSKEARQENMQDAFSSTCPPDPSHTYIMFDDVATTGATLIAAAKALYDRGANDVSLLALAH